VQRVMQQSERRMQFRQDPLIFPARECLH